MWLALVAGILAFAIGFAAGKRGLRPRTSDRDLARYSRRWFLAFSILLVGVGIAAVVLSQAGPEVLERIDYKGGSGQGSGWPLVVGGCACLFLGGYGSASWSAWRSSTEDVG